MEKAPDAFRTISEVADDLDVPQHVLRFWESRFAQIKPMKRGGGRRYYRPDDVALLRGIRHLLYGQGYTIRGVQRILREQGVRVVQSIWEEGAEQPLSAPDDAAAEALADEDADAETERGLGGRLRPSGRVAETHRPAPHAGRREPSFAGPGEARTVAEPMPVRPQHGRLTPADRQALQAALAELAECRRALESASDETA
ncbi:MAG: MerR family transcriptional regulator [Rhizobiales bacterium]|nr:MerR family transcriptional regulator [Hyphomicrobiales bacterium]